MRKIAVLDPHTIDQIAAGEVVERPSSVVKELAENAMDAGATAVTVEIAGGGKKLIRVTDNGSGIDREQVATAFLSHATSKIEKVEDLETITSLGFRGEALSTISAVAKVELITRTREEMTGTRYVIEGGQEMALEEVGAPEGSTFLVRELFFNVPARGKFLKSDLSEAGDISSLMEQLALSHPEIAFKFMNGGQIRLQTSGNGKLRDVIYSIYGREIARSLSPVTYENEFLKIEGFAGRPEISRGNRSFENYYVNGRYVRSSVLTKAIEDAYKGFLMQHRFPFVTLNLTVKGDAVDVNVHPRKLEVRFSRGPQVYDAVFDAVRSAIIGQELIPRVEPGHETKRQATSQTPVQATVQPSVQTPVQMSVQAPVPATSQTQVQSSVQAPAQPSVQKPVQAAAHSGSLREEPVYYQPKPAGPALTPAEELLFTAKLEAPSPAPEVEVSVPEETPVAAAAEPEGIVPGEAPDVTETTGPVKEPPSGETSDAQEEAPVSAPQEEPRTAAPEAVPEQLELFQERLLAPESRIRHRLIGQVFDTYWLVEFGDSFYIIDQHAAHEKIYYERFVKQFREQTIQSQLLAPPMVVTLTLEEEHQLTSNMSLFENFGFEIEPYGGREYCIRAVPATLYGFGEEELFHELLDRLPGERSKDPLGVFAHRLATMACKAAVKGGNRLSEQEANAMIDELLKLEEPYHCPHGRPTIIEMTRTDMEKKFHRIV